MEREVFKFRVKEINCGNSSVVLTINGSIIPFEATYVGLEPLATLIHVCADIMADRNNTQHIIWEDEPGTLEMRLRLDKNMLHLNIVKEKEERQTWDEYVPFDVFLSEIIREGVRVLNEYGLYGYYRSWQDHVEFPISNFLYLLGGVKEMWKEDSCYSDITKEIESLMKIIKKK